MLFSIPEITGSRKKLEMLKFVALFKFSVSKNIKFQVIVHKSKFLPYPPKTSQHAQTTFSSSFLQIKSNIGRINLTVIKFFTRFGLRAEIVVV